MKIPYEFEEYFIPDCDQPSYSRNVQIYNSLRYSLLVSMTNDNGVKSFMEPQAYKVIRNHANEISECTIISIIIH